LVVALPADAKSGHGKAKAKPGHGKAKKAKSGHGKAKAKRVHRHAAKKPGRGAAKPAKQKAVKKVVKKVAKAAGAKRGGRKVAAKRRPTVARPSGGARSLPAARGRAGSVRATPTTRRATARVPRASRRAATRAATVAGAAAAARGRARAAPRAAPAAPTPRATEPAAPRFVRTGEPVSKPSSDSGGPVKTVTKVIKEVPGWLWALLAAIAGLCVAAFATSIAATIRARRATRQRREVMENVGLLQAALLPPVPSELAGLALSVAYRPAEGLAAGGDFYDAISLRDGRVGLIIGDVSGHGKTSLAQTALVRFTVRAYLEAGLDPRDALKLSQSALEDKLGEEFVTVMLAVFDPREAVLVYAGAGHPPPLLRGAPPIPAVTAASAPLIGVGLGTGLRQTTVSLRADTTICLYTDGLVEAMVDNRMLGRNKLAGMIDTLGDDATAEALLARVVEEADRANDDMAVCVAHVQPAAGRDRPPFLMEELEVSRRDVGHGVVQRFLNACDIFGTDVDEAMAKARTLSEEFGTALLRVSRHEHPQRVEVGAPGVERLVATRGR
jgi:serine phosphatase RsbU (regulator of sigma subunit)